MRLAVLSSHPIQYQAPLFRRLAAHPAIDLEVLFFCDWGVKQYFDPGFGKSFAWDVPVTTGYKHRFLKNLRANGGPTGFLGLVNPGVAGAMLREKFDAVLVHGWAFATNWIAVLAAAAAKVPVLLRAETSIILQRDGIHGACKRAILSPLFDHVAAFLAIGSNNVAFYRSFGVQDDQIFLAPYSVDNGFFMLQDGRLRLYRDAIRAGFGITDEAPVVLFCAKLLKRKRPMDLLMAYRSLTEGSRPWLLFAGDGYLRAEAEQYVATQRLDRVRFLGFLNQTELPKAYVAADALVLPSDFETWGLVVNEAMCFGLPVIVSDRVGSAADLVQNGFNGYVYPAGDVGALALHLSAIVQDPDLRNRMGYHSKNLISSWGIEQTAAGVLSALASLGIES